MTAFCATCSHNATLHAARGCTLCACPRFVPRQGLVIAQPAAHALLRAARAALTLIERNTLTYALLVAAIRDAEVQPEGAPR